MGNFVIISFLQSIPGVAHIKEGYNPATWMLDISSTSAEAQLGVDFAQIYRDSALHRYKLLIVDFQAYARCSIGITLASIICT
jgi:hypothetical protein